jgi:hypothetical protein
VQVRDVCRCRGGDEHRPDFWSRLYQHSEDSEQHPPGLERNVVDSRPEITRNRTSCPAPRLTWRARFVCARLRTGARFLVNGFLEAVVCHLSPSSHIISGFTSSLLRIMHGQRKYSCNWIGVRLDILRVIETPSAAFKDKIRFPQSHLCGVT